MVRLLDGGWASACGTCCTCHFRNSEFYRCTELKKIPLQRSIARIFGFFIFPSRRHVRMRSVSKLVGENPCFLVYGRWVPLSFPTTILSSTITKCRGMRWKDTPYIIPKQMVHVVSFFEFKIALYWNRERERKKKRNRYSLESTVRSTACMQQP